MKKLLKMEKVLRKVSVKDRLPEIEGEYFISSDNILAVGYCFNYKDKEGSQNHWKEVTTDFYIGNVEYWYEEVSLDSLLALEKQKWINEQLVYREALYIEIDNHIQNLAKEKYKKALSILDDVVLKNLEEYNYDKTFKHALRIAAGLEDVV